MRSLWSEFYAGADGILFMLDSADHDRLAEARNVRASLIVANLFLLLLFTKESVKSVSFTD